MNYQEALKYIHNINKSFCNPGLERIKYMCDIFNHPEKDLKFIHVAGTNGKGSTCSMLNSILIENGLKVGLFTSPYLVFFNERMRVNGVDISNNELVEIVEYIKPEIDKMEDKPTEFELITLIGFMYFKRHNCDIVILETGMGGRYDSTNIIENPLLTIITGISIDHTNYLGNTIEQIALEKAGIIKKRTPILYGGEDKVAEVIIKKEANDNNAPFYNVDYSLLKVKSMDLEGTYFDFYTHKDLFISLLGEYQPRNACIVIKAISLLNELGLNISNDILFKGLKKTSWLGRFEVLNKDPLFIFDGAHNAQGIKAAVKSVKQYFKNQKVYILTGVLKDKEYDVIAKELSSIALKAFVVTLNNLRALNALEYSKVLKEYDVDSEAYQTLNEAYSNAIKKAKEENTPLICLGSLYLYSELMKVMN